MVSRSSGNGSDERNGEPTPFRLSLVDSKPQQKPIQLDDGNVLYGYSKGDRRRVLRSVEAAFLDAWKTGHHEDGTQRSTAEFDESLTQMIMAVVPQMTHEDADSLDRTEIWQLLEYLGWFKRVTDGTDVDTEPTSTDSDPQTIAPTTGT